MRLKLSGQWGSWMVLAAVSTTLSASAPAETVDFDDLPLASGGFENGAGLTGGRFVSRGAAFNNYYGVDPKYGAYWGCWSYSKVTDTANHSYTNQYSAITAGGYGGPQSNYGVAYWDSFTPVTISFPQGTAIGGACFSNTTYAYYTMKDGNSFSRKFGRVVDSHGQTISETGAKDWFKLTITGKDASGLTTGSKDFYLADYRFDDLSQNYIISDWTWVGLASLGSNVRKLEFSLSSTDNSDFGGFLSMNTPAYFALDNLITLPPKTWGGEVDAKWSTAANWGNSAPAGDETIAFDGFAQRASINDLTPGKMFTGLTFNAGAGNFLLSGSRIDLSGPVLNNSIRAQKITLDLNLATGGGEFNAMAGDITLGGKITGSAGLTKTGSHKLQLMNNNSYAGPTLVSQGVLEISSLAALPPGGSVTIGAGGTVVLASGLNSAEAASSQLVAPASAGSAVPEPGTLMLLAALGIVALACWMRRR